MVLVPTPPLSPPSKIPPGALPVSICQFPFSFSLCLLSSVSVSRPSPPASGHPSSVWWNPPADSSSGLSTNVLSWLPEPHL